MSDFNLYESLEFVNDYLQEASKEEADKAFDKGVVKRNTRRAENKDYHKFMSDGYHSAGTGAPKTRKDVASGMHNFNKPELIQANKALGGSNNKGKFIGAQDAYRKTIRKAYSDPTVRQGKTPDHPEYWRFAYSGSDAYKKAKKEYDEKRDKWQKLADKSWDYDTVNNKAEALAAKARGRKVLSKEHRALVDAKKEKLRQDKRNADTKMSVLVGLEKRAKEGKLSPKLMEKMKKMYPSDFKEYAFEETLDNILEAFDLDIITEEEFDDLMGLIEYTESDIESDYSEDYDEYEEEDSED